MQLMQYLSSCWFAALHVADLICAAGAAAAGKGPLREELAARQAKLDELVAGFEVGRGQAGRDIVALAGWLAGWLAGLHSSSHRANSVCAILSGWQLASKWTGHSNQAGAEQLGGVSCMQVSTTTLSEASDSSI
jgi:hypothetical protein